MSQETSWRRHWSLRCFKTVWDFRRSSSPLLLVCLISSPQPSDPCHVMDRLGSTKKHAIYYFVSSSFNFFFQQLCHWKKSMKEAPKKRVESFHPSQKMITVKLLSWKLLGKLFLKCQGWTGWVEAARKQAHYNLLYLVKCLYTPQVVNSPACMICPSVQRNVKHWHVSNWFILLMSRSFTRYHYPYWSSQ